MKKIDKIKGIHTTSFMAYTIGCFAFYLLGQAIEPNLVAGYIDSTFLYSGYFFFFVSTVLVSISLEKAASIAGVIGMFLSLYNTVGYFYVVFPVVFYCVFIYTCYMLFRLKIENIDAEKRLSEIFCHSCGAKSVTESSAYCFACGAKMDG